MKDPYLNKPATLAFVARDNRGREGRFRYWRAVNGMVFLDQAPPNLSTYYEGGFQPIPVDVAGLEEAAQAEAYKIDQLRAYKAGGDYLEIGPWTGMAALNASRAGFRVTTLEMNADCVHLMRRAGLNAIRTDDPIATLTADNTRYDAIAMWHSIEHVPEPWRLLELAAERLRPGGVLLVATPNPESAQARLFGRGWFHLDAPRHLHLLPMSMVQEIGERQGLELVDATTDDALGKLLDKQGWEWPLWRHVAPHRRRGRLRVVPIVAFRELMIRLFRRDDRDGGAYTVVMRRPDRGSSDRPAKSVQARA